MAGNQLNHLKVVLFCVVVLVTLEVVELLLLCRHSPPAKNSPIYRVIFIFAIVRRFKKKKKIKEYQSHYMSFNNFKLVDKKVRVCDYFAKKKINF